jgi:type I restriction enzyme S subunit
MGMKGRLTWWYSGGWFGMSEWKECKLGEVINFGNGKSRPKIEGTIPIYGGNGILGYCDQFNYKDETIIIGRVGAYCGSAYYENKPIWVSDNALSAKANGENDTKFLFYFLKNLGLNQFAEGSSHPLVTQTLLNSIDVEIPDNETEQRAIASVLSSLDDKIDLLHRQNKTLEAMAETLFRQWFVEGADESWTEGYLEDIIEFNPKYKLSKGNEAPYLEMSNVSIASYCPIGWYDREFNSGVKFKNGDTLFARITPCLENGKTCFVDFLDNAEIVGWGSTEYIVMKMKKPFHPFISYIIAKNEEFREFAISCMTGSSGRQRAQANDIKEYGIRIPPNDVIDKLNIELPGFVKKLKNNSKQIRTLEKLRDTLLPKLMSGKVRVEYE